MKILISGGGLAGLTLAYWLHHWGMEPIIIEQAPELRREGYGIDFFGTGYDVAERMGILEQLAQQQLPIDTIDIVNRGGKPVVRMTIERMQQIMDGRYLALMHWSLEEVLYAAIKDTVEVRFGRSLTSVQQTESAVQVTLDDGSTETADLLIGADGIHSNVRRLEFGPEAEFARYLGYYVACFRLPNTFSAGRSWQNYVEPQRQVGIYPSSQPDELITLYMWAAPDTGPVPATARLATLQRVFNGMGWHGETFLQQIDSTTPIFCDTVTQIVMPRWHTGRVALVGDACGCMTLVSGQGASMALGGAYMLAEALHTQPSWSSAFQAYETLLRPHIEQRQDGARDFAKSFVPATQWGITVQHALMKTLMHDPFNGLLRRMFGSASVLQERAIQRLPQSSDAILGYQFSGKIQSNDYTTFLLDVLATLREHPQVRLLLAFDDVRGISLKALWADLQFGLHHGREVEKLALVGDQRWSAWLARLARPMYAEAVQHFGAADQGSAWSWLRS